MELVAYFQGKCGELQQLIKESEEAREQFPTWLVDAQIAAGFLNSKEEKKLEVKHF